MYIPDDIISVIQPFVPDHDILENRLRMIQALHLVSNVTCLESLQVNLNKHATDSAIHIWLHLRNCDYETTLPDCRENIQLFYKCHFNYLIE